MRASEPVRRSASVQPALPGVAVRQRERVRRQAARRECAVWREDVRAARLRRGACDVHAGHRRVASHPRVAHESGEQGRHALAEEKVLLCCDA